MLGSKQLVSVLYLFVITVLMMTFSWIGLAEFKWYSYDELEHLPGINVNADQLVPDLLLATRVLQDTDRLESKHVGVGGSISKNHVAFNEIVLHKDADLAFEYLLGTDNITAKVYAMQGFQQLNKQRFNELLPFFKHNNQPIHMQSGCSGFIRPVSSVFDLSEARRMTNFNDQQ